MDASSKYEHLYVHIIHMVYGLYTQFIHYTLDLGAQMDVAAAVKQQPHELASSVHACHHQRTDSELCMYTHTNSRKLTWTFVTHTKRLQHMHHRQHRQPIHYIYTVLYYIYTIYIYTVLYYIYIYCTIYTIYTILYILYYIYIYIYYIYILYYTIYIYTVLY